MKCLIITMTIFMASWVQAGDRASFQTIGFSKSGEHYAYLQEGFFDASGFYWVEINVVQVLENRLLKRVFKFNEREDDEWDETRHEVTFQRAMKEVLLGAKL